MWHALFLCYAHLTADMVALVCSIVRNSTYPKLVFTEIDPEWFRLLVHCRMDYWPLTIGLTQLTTLNQATLANCYSLCGITLMVNTDDSFMTWCLLYYNSSNVLWVVKEILMFAKFPILICSNITKWVTHGA